MKKFHSDDENLREKEAGYNGPPEQSLADKLAERAQNEENRRASSSDVTSPPPPKSDQ